MKPALEDQVYIVVTDRPQRVWVCCFGVIHTACWRTSDNGDNLREIDGNPGLLNAAMLMWNGRERIVTTFAELERHSQGWGAWDEPFEVAQPREVEPEPRREPQDPEVFDQIDSLFQNLKVPDFDGWQEMPADRRITTSWPDDTPVTDVVVLCRFKNDNSDSHPVLENHFTVNQDYFIQHKETGGTRDIRHNQEVLQRFVNECCRYRHPI